MDYSVLYIIGIGLVSALIPLTIYCFSKKKNINPTDLIKDIEISESVVIFVSTLLKDMKFSDDENIEKTTDIIMESLDYMKALDDSKEDKIKKSTAFALELCNKANIEMNKNRLYILNSVIIMSYNMIYALEEKNNIK